MNGNFCLHKPIFVKFNVVSEGTILDGVVLKLMLVSLTTAWQPCWKWRQTKLAPNSKPDLARYFVFAQNHHRFTIPIRMKGGGQETTLKTWYGNKQKGGLVVWLEMVFFITTIVIARGWDLHNYCDYSCSPSPPFPKKKGGRGGRVWAESCFSIMHM